jgi:predicted DNA-binding ribbon-helix-helix protein
MFIQPWRWSFEFPHMSLRTSFTLLGYSLEMKMYIRLQRLALRDKRASIISLEIMEVEIYKTRTQNISSAVGIATDYWPDDRRVGAEVPVW